MIFETVAKIQPQVFMTNAHCMQRYMYQYIKKIKRSTSDRSNARPGDQVCVYVTLSTYRCVLCHYWL